MGLLWSVLNGSSHPVKGKRRQPVYHPNWCLPVRHKLGKTETESGFCEEKMKPNGLLGEKTHALFSLSRLFFSWMFSEIADSCGGTAPPGSLKWQRGLQRCRCGRPSPPSGTKMRQRPRPLLQWRHRFSPVGFQTQKNKPPERAGFMTARLLPVSLCFTRG